MAEERWTSLFASHGEALETALWATVRVLEEHASLAHRLSRRALDRDNGPLAESYRRKAVAAEEQAATIRGVVETLPDTAITSSWQIVCLQCSGAVLKGRSWKATSASR